MLAICPNDPSHNRFITTAHVMQEWVVDETGEFLDEANACLDVTHHPNSSNLWSCVQCGVDATVTD